MPDNDHNTIESALGEILGENGIGTFTAGIPEPLHPLCFPVQSVSPESIFPEHSFASNLRQVIYRPDKKKVVAFAGGDYQILQNHELILEVTDFMDRLFGREGYRVMGNVVDDRKFYASFIGDKSLYEITRDDSICPMVEIRNSYDGSMKRSVSLSFYRQICSNGMHGFSKAFEISERHNGSGRRINLDKIERELESIGEKINRFKAMTDRQITPDEMSELLERIEKNKGLGYPKKSLREVPMIVLSEKEQLGTPLNSWLLYNGLNNALFKAESKKPHEERVKIDANVLRLVESM